MECLRRPDVTNSLYASIVERVCDLGERILINGASRTAIDEAGTVQPHHSSSEA
jgi:hypothetical protein